MAAVAENSTVRLICARISQRRASKKRVLRRKHEISKERAKCCVTDLSLGPHLVAQDLSHVGTHRPITAEIRCSYGAIENVYVFTEPATPGNTSNVYAAPAVSIGHMGAAAGQTSVSFAPNSREEAIIVPVES